MHPRNPILVALLGLCLLVLGTSPAWGQVAGTGTVAGTVVDNSGAVIPAAKITLTNTGTAASRVTDSNSKGQYIFAFVNPGSYFLKFEKQGFQSTVVSEQTVSLGLQLTVNATLQVGSVTTVVTVTATPGAELQTLNATVGTTIGPETFLNLPNPSRDASTLAVLQPGQNINGNVAGAVTDQNTFQVDGGYATDDMSGDNNSYIASFSSNPAGVGNYHSSGFNQAPSAVIPVPVTSVQDFKVSTANQTADFNGGAGSQVQLVTKSGTNVFHGSIYEYYSDVNFGGANTWDNNRTGKRQPSTHLSQFGADAGGKIPGSNFLGGSWYIFGNYEGLRYPLSGTFERNFPTASLRAGLIKINHKIINLNPTPTVDPATGQTIQPTPCPNSPNGLCDPRGLGLNPVISTLWNTYLPPPNDCTHGDGLNYCGYKGTISTPLSSNFGVARVDHDFSKSEHFNATYHYYKLTKTVSDQWDVGGFFPGDVKGQYSAIRNKPQNPWLYTAGLTSEISPTLTNDFHFSYTRNWWAYLDPSGVPNVAGYPAALEIGGETSNPFGPYNTNNQSTRTRFWDGKDWMLRDDITWIHGAHLFQMGGIWQRNDDTHKRNDNGESINTFEQYLIGEGNGTSLGSVGVDLSNFVPAGVTSLNKYGNLYSMVLGMVDETQSLFTRSVGPTLNLRPRVSCAIPGVAATAACIGSPHAINSSIIPTYNIYLTDAWHMKPTFTLNYGLGYTVEMPPYETGGGYQTVMVDQNGDILYAQDYFNRVKSAALQGQAFAPVLGFAAIRNVKGHSHYPYDPFYGGISPRVGFAWNFRPDTVIRAGYGRLYGRINGVDPVLAELLTPGLMEPVTCGGPTIQGGCGGTPVNVFRVGVDGKVAPLPPPTQNLPQPWYPGLNAETTGAGEGLDPYFKPNNSDEFTLSIQHQLNPKILVEAGYIGRLIHNEVQYYSLTSVPYMMTVGGQSFANAWKNVMLATNNGNNLGSIPVQPFFETALGGPTSAYCTGFANCTTAFVQNNGVNGNGDMTISDAFDAWSSVSNIGAWVFGRTMTSDPINSPFGSSGMSPSYVTTFSNGYGNYNAGYLQLNVSGWHGLTLRSNFTYGKALGTGAVVQATSSYSTVDPWNQHNDYGPQYYDEKFVFNLYLNYDLPFFSTQRGFAGRVLGGWSIAPIYTMGSGFPIEANTSVGDCGTFGECNPSYVGGFENQVITGDLHYSSTRKQGVFGTTCGTAGAGQNVFSNPDAACALFRDPILGLDGQIGGGGPVHGLPFWNLDMDLTKKVKITERASASILIAFTNVMNHMQAADPFLWGGDPTTFGVLGASFGGAGDVQANVPRRMQVGVTIDW